MAAVGKDLRLEFALEPLGRGFDVARLAGNAERRIGERDGGLQAGHAAAGIAGGKAETAHLADQAAQEAPIEADVGVLQDERRLAEPGNDAAR